MKAKYFYTQCAEETTVKLLDKYHEGVTKTIATYNEANAFKSAMLAEEDLDAVKAFFEHCASEERTMVAL